MIVTNGNQPDAIKFNVGSDRQIVGPIYVSDPANIDMYGPASAELFVSDGDVWHKDATCATPLAPGVLSNRVVFAESAVRGPICTTSVWSSIVSAPPVPPNLSSLPVDPPFLSDPPGPPGSPPPCRIFQPGHYTSPPAIVDGVPPNESHVYFQSGNYWFDDVGEWLIDADDVRHRRATRTGGTSIRHHVRRSTRGRSEQRRHPR